MVIEVMVESIGNMIRIKNCYSLLPKMGQIIGLRSYNYKAKSYKYTRRIFFWYQLWYSAIRTVYKPLVMIASGFIIACGNTMRLMYLASV